jgi:hypothetical protein
MVDVSWFKIGSLRSPNADQGSFATSVTQVSRISSSEKARYETR